MDSAQRTFLHVDMDAFFTSVEQRDHPELRGRPVVVGAPPDRRGVVAAASYEARRYGIHSAMPSRTAFQKCPHAVFLAGSMARYKAVSRQVMRIFESYTPLVQPLSIDEAFLDVSGARRLFGDGVTIARKIRHDIRGQTGLTASVGVAPNLFLAKIASDMDKPDGLTLVPTDPAGILEFLAPLPIGRLWGVGKVTQGKLLHLGIPTIGALQQMDLHALEKAVGAHAAHHFGRLARGIDDRPIETGCREKSISNETTFAEDLADREQVAAVCKRLVDKVGRRLRAAGLLASSVHLKLRWSDFSTITRQAQLPWPCCDDTTLREAGLALLEKNLGPRPVRLVGFGVGGLHGCDGAAGLQLDLFDAPDRALRDKRNRLSRAADAIKHRYGDRSLRRGSDLK